MLKTKTQNLKSLSHRNLSQVELIFNSNDSNDLKEKMKELIENTTLRNKVTENSKLRRDDFFGWDEYAKKLEDLYKEIISGNV